MKKLIAAATISVMAIAAPATAGDCVEDGQPGMTTGDGGCVTVAEYDVMFSVEALSDTVSLAFPDQSVAEVYGLVEADVPSERQLGAGFGETFTFADIVYQTGLNSYVY